MRMTQDSYFDSNSLENEKLIEKKTKLIII